MLRPGLSIPFTQARCPTTTGDGTSSGARLSVRKRTAKELNEAGKLGWERAGDKDAGDKDKANC